MPRFLILILTAVFYCPALQAEFEDYLKHKTDNWQLKLNGRLHFDHNGTNQALVDSEDDHFQGTRRLRLTPTISYQDILDLKIDYDFADNQLTPRDLYFQFNKLPYFDSLLIGHMKEPMGFEETVSSNDIAFIERSLTQTFNPVRNSGLQLKKFYEQQLINWQVGLFQNNNINLNKIDNSYSLTSRITKQIPLSPDQILHLGINYRYLDLRNNHENLSSRLETNFLGVPLDLESGLTSYSNTYGLELFYQQDSTWLQSEVFILQSKNQTNQQIISDSAYFQIGHFLSGENQKYSAKNGLIKNPEEFNSELGALELTARFSWLDLNDSNLEQGRVENSTFGMNYYLNKFVRLMINYTYSDYSLIGHRHLITCRSQVDF